MSKLVSIVATAAICLPLGALLQRDASADRRKNSLPGDVAVRHGNLGGVIEGHRHLSRALQAMSVALAEIETSVQEGEPVWSDKSGRASATKRAIETATASLDDTAAWVSAGMASNGQGGRFVIQRRIP